MNERLRRLLRRWLEIDHAPRLARSVTGAAALEIAACETCRNDPARVDEHVRAILLRFREASHPAPSLQAAPPAEHEQGHR